MPYMYRLRKDWVHDEEEKEYIVYGIDIITSDEKILSSVPDIFFDKQRALAFVKLCNECELELIHLADAVEDAITEQYALFE